MVLIIAADMSEEFIGCVECVGPARIRWSGQPGPRQGVQPALGLGWKPGTWPDGERQWTKKRAPSWPTQQSWAAQAIIRQTPMDIPRGYLGRCSETHGSFRENSSFKLLRHLLEVRSVFVL